MREETHNLSEVSWFSLNRSTSVVGYRNNKLFFSVIQIHVYFWTLRNSADHSLHILGLGLLWLPCFFFHLEMLFVQMEKFQSWIYFLIWEENSRKLLLFPFSANCDDVVGVIGYNFPLTFCFHFRCFRLHKLRKEDHRRMKPEPGKRPKQVPAKFNHGGTLCFN